MIEVYEGTDKSSYIYFDAGRELLDNGTYLFSKVGSANVAYVTGDKVSATIKLEDDLDRGYDRRVILVDGVTSGIDDIESLRQQGSISLTESRTTEMFDGSINEDLTPYRYGRLFGSGSGLYYNLGDTVRLVGDYGLDTLARVTEYIRSKDATGTKGYPTLTTIK